MYLQKQMEQVLPGELPVLVRKVPGSPMADQQQRLVAKARRVCLVDGRIYSGGILKTPGLEVKLSPQSSLF